MAKTTSSRRGVSNTPKSKKRAAVARKPATTKQTRRPSHNERPGVVKINRLTEQVMNTIAQLNEFAANLRGLDRQRHNGVGLKRQGFIEAALRMAENFPQYYPHWLTTEKFQNDLDVFNAIRSLVEACRSLEEKAWNINVEASDMVYTDALEYYSLVQDAARRRVDSAETLYNELNLFFKRGGKQTEDEPTEKEIKRDVNALLHGKKNGKVVVENFNPKIAKGNRKLVDKTYKTKAAFKETEESELE